MSLLRKWVSKCRTSENQDENVNERVSVKKKIRYPASRSHIKFISNLPEFQNRSSISKSARDSRTRNHGEAWFSRLLSRTSSMMRNNITKIQSEHKFFDFLTRNTTKKDLFVGEFLSVLNNVPNTFLLKANIQNNNEHCATYHIQLENIPVCKECDIIFNGIDELLSTLINSKVEKVSIDGQNECYNCTICKINVSNEETLKTHLMKHIESNDIVCDQCEAMANESFTEHYEQHITSPDRNLKKIRLLRVIASCNLCSKIMLTVPTVLAEVMTINQLNLSESLLKSRFSCYECACSLPSCAEDDKRNIIETRKSLCEKCKKIERFRASSVATMRKSRCSWISPTEELPLSAVFLDKFPPRRRHIFIVDITEPIDIKTTDFIVENTYSDIDNIWFSCRFCCKSSKHQTEMAKHILNHISVKKAVCNDCETKASSR